MSTRAKLDWDVISKKIFEDEKKKSYSKDTGLEFKPTLKEDGTAAYIIRFCEPPRGESLPIVKIYNHGFKTPTGQWFIENCPTTLGRQCPVCKHNSSIWDTDPDTVRKRSRKLSYWTNIIVLQDAQNPENEGKVFKYRIGVKIFEKIKEAMQVVNTVFDYETGNNFKLKIKLTKAGKDTYQNYDSSTFSDPSPLTIGGKVLSKDEISEIESKLYPLSPIVDESEFKSYEELEKTFESKVNPGTSNTQTQGSTKKVQKQEVTMATHTPTQSSTKYSDDIETEDDDTNFFKILQED